MVLVEEIGNEASVEPAFCFCSQLHLGCPCHSAFWEVSSRQKQGISQTQLERHHQQLLQDGGLAIPRLYQFMARSSFSSRLEINLFQFPGPSYDVVTARVLLIYLRDKVVQGSMRSLRPRLWPELPFDEATFLGKVILMPPSTTACKLCLYHVDVTPCQSPAV